MEERQHPSQHHQGPGVINNKLSRETILILVGTPDSKTLRSLCVFGRCNEFYERYKSQCKYAQYVQHIVEILQ